MKPEDAFLCKLGGKELPFGTFNHKTIGMLVVSYSFESFNRFRLLTDKCRNEACGVKGGTPLECLMIDFMLK